MGKASSPGLYWFILTFSDAEEAMRPKSRSLPCSCRLVTSRSLFSKMVVMSGEVDRPRRGPSSVFSMKLAEAGLTI